MKDKKQLLASLGLLVATTFWGTGYSIQSLMGSTFGDFTVVFFKTVSGILLIPICLLLKKKFTKHAIIGGIAVGSVCFVACWLQQIGITMTTASKASFITSLYIIFVPIIGLFLKKKPKPKIWISVVIALIGMYFLCINGEDFSINFGDLITLVAAVFFALQIIIIDKFVADSDPLVFACTQQTSCATLSGVLMFLVEKPKFADVLTNIYPILFLALFTGLAALIIQNVAQKYCDPAVASIVMGLESVCGAIAGWLILNQALTVRELIGCAIMFVAILIAQ